jgi:signal transduction histidine kinase
MLLGIVEEEVGRLNRLVADLLRFARPVAVSWGDVNLREFVERTRGLVPPEIAVEVDIPEESRLETVTLDAGLLRLVLENLVENACQAMPEGGRLSIVVRAEELEVGTGVSIDVRDTGRGMDARTLERALKPFFSTRPQGTGLGLAIVDRIVRAHGGTVSLESAVGCGTAVRLLIPLDEASRRRRLSGSFAGRSGSEGGE